MEKELADGDAVICQVTFDVANVLEPLVPDFAVDQFSRQFLFFEKLWMYANCKSLFIVTAIEDTDAAAFGQALQTTPQVVVVQVFARRRFKGIDLTSLRVDTRHNVLDRSVLAGRIHGL